MNRLVTVVGAAVLFAAWGIPAFADDAKTIERGKQVYAEQKCKLCHSIAGEGNAKGSLDGCGSKLTAAEIREWIVNPKEMAAKTKAARKPAMKAYPALPKEDLDALVAYIHSLKKK